MHIPSGRPATADDHELEAVAVFPAASEAATVTVVVPFRATVPDAWLQVTLVTAPIACTDAELASYESRDVNVDARRDHGGSR